MEHDEIVIGQGTYEVGRTFRGTAPAAELLLERLTRQTELAEPGFDGAVNDGV